ncbi:MAG: ATP-binding protein [Rhodoferax sp.]
MARLIPRTLFGRLALLLFVAVLASHVLALTLMFEVLGPPPHGPGPNPGPPPGGPPPLFHLGLWLDIGVRLTALMIAAWIGARWLSQPVLRLASAARDLGRDIHGPPLLEDGTDECREATRVFNQMQAQICRQLSERDNFVAAVSHDLRTPLTRMALRAETLADADQRHQFGRDIYEMNTMITSTLDYLRGAAEPEPFVLLDLPSLLHTVADDQQACGHPVRVVEADASRASLSLRTQASALRRCVGNLVDNAVRYGGHADIAWRAAPHQVCIEVRDGGPGIADDELDKVLAPFYRVEGSRNRSSGGVGLGLSIASDIARRLQGQLTLRNGAAGGLVATLTLPR